MDILKKTVWFGGTEERFFTPNKEQDPARISRFADVVGKTISSMMHWGGTVNRKYNYKHSKNFAHSRIKNLLTSTLVSKLDPETQQRYNSNKNRDIPFDCVTLCLSSVVYSSLEYRFKTLIPVVQSIIKVGELNLVYSGTNKVQSLEDTLLFFPNLFK